MRGNHKILQLCDTVVDMMRHVLVVSRYTEIPKRYPIFPNTDTDTDVGILNTENTENSVRYSPPGAVLPLKLGSLISLTGRGR